MAKNSNQRAVVKNPNNPAFKAAADNRSVQLNTPPKATVVVNRPTTGSKKS
jgi:hypothetical protein